MLSVLGYDDIPDVFEHLHDESTSDVETGVDSYSCVYASLALVLTYVDLVLGCRIVCRK